jgi:hypothetical protein
MDELRANNVEVEKLRKKRERDRDAERLAWRKKKEGLLWNRETWLRGDPRRTFRTMGYQFLVSSALLFADCLPLATETAPLVLLICGFGRPASGAAAFANGSCSVGIGRDSDSPSGSEPEGRGGKERGLDGPEGREP